MVSSASRPNSRTRKRQLCGVSNSSWQRKLRIYQTDELVRSIAYVLAEFVPLLSVEEACHESGNSRIGIVARDVLLHWHI